MPAYITIARRAALLAIIAMAAACSNSDGDTGTGIGGGDNGGQNGGGNNGGNNGGSTIYSIDITGAEEVVVGYMGQLQATPRTENGGAVSAPVTWTTSDAAIVEVDQAGNLTGRGAGTATITASAAGKSRQRAVRVVPRQVSFLVKDSQEAPTLQRGDIGWFAVYPLDQHRQLMHDIPVTYTAADPSIIEVNGSQLIARKGGATTVTATANGVSATTVLRVAESTMYPLRRAKGQALPAVLLESTHVDEYGVTITRRLIATSGFMAVSNVADQWTQSMTVEEWELRTYGNGSTIGGMTKAETHVASGTFTIDPDTKALLLREPGSTRVQAWAMPEQWPRGFRVHDTSEQPSGILLEYARW